MHKVKVNWLTSLYSYIALQKSIQLDVIFYTGIYFHLNGVNYSNNSEVAITDIGSGDEESLLCITDNPNCCYSGRIGEWYYPNTSKVKTNGDGDSFYRNRGQSVVRLHRRHNVVMPTGEFYCEIPDDNGVDQRIYVIIFQGTITGYSLL